MDELMDKLGTANYDLDQAIIMPVKQKAIETIRTALEARDNQG